jgi:hypothetical protein
MCSGVSVYRIGMMCAPCSSTIEERCNGGTATLEERNLLATHDKLKKWCTLCSNVCVHRIGMMCAPCSSSIEMLCDSDEAFPEERNLLATHNKLKKWCTLCPNVCVHRIGMMCAPCSSTIEERCNGGTATLEERNLLATHDKLKKWCTLCSYVCVHRIGMMCAPCSSSIEMLCDSDEAFPEERNLLATHNRSCTSDTRKRAAVKDARKNDNLVVLREIADQSPSGKLFAKVKEQLGSTFNARDVLAELRNLGVAVASVTDAHLNIVAGRFDLKMAGAAASCLCVTMRATREVNSSVYEHTTSICKRPTFSHSLTLVLPKTAVSKAGAKKSRSLVIQRGISIDNDIAITSVMDAADQIELFRKACYKNCYWYGKRKYGVIREPTTEEIESLIREYVTDREMQLILLTILKSESTDEAECLKKTSLKHGLVFTTARSSTPAWWIGDIIGYGFGSSHSQSEFKREEFYKFVSHAGEGNHDKFLALFFLFWAGFDGSIIHTPRNKCFEVIVPDLKESECNADHTVKSLFINDIFAAIFGVVPNQYSRPSSVPDGKPILILRVCKRKDLYRIARRLNELVDAVHFDGLPRKKKAALEELIRLAYLESVSGKLLVLIITCVTFVTH